MSLGTEAGTELLWPQRGQADGHPAAFPDTLCPAPAERRPQSLRGSEHPPLLPAPPQSPFSASGAQQASPWSLSEPGAPVGLGAAPGAPQAPGVCVRSPHQAEPRRVKATRGPSSREPAFAWTQWAPLVLWDGRGRTGGGGRGDSRERRRGPWTAEGPWGFYWIIRTPQAESQGRLG